MIFRTVFIGLALLASPLLSHAQEDQNLSSKRFAIRMLEHMNAGDFDSIVVHFDSTLKRKVNATFLDRSYSRMQQQFGDFKGYKEPNIDRKDSITVAVVPIEFTRYDLELMVTTNNFSKEIVGIFIRPVKFSKEYVSPDYANNLCLGEKNLPLEGNGVSLPGRLSVPCKGEKFPVVIMVHGSGPNDMDGTVGPNKPFKDLAYQLAAQGIASYRYDKRTKAAPQSLGEDSMLTVQEEVINDVHAAIRLMGTQDFIDADQIFVLGHSLGAILAPRIANTSPLPLGGIIMMAAAGRPLEDVIKSQFIYLSNLDSTINLEEQVAINQATNQASNVKKLKKDPTINRSSLPLNIPAAYWLDLQKKPTISELKKLKVPALILHGDRDYQVTKEDFELLKSAITKKPEVYTQNFPNLNHLFLPGKGISKPSEYEEAGHIPLEVGQEIIKFINKQLKKNG